MGQTMVDEGLRLDLSLRLFASGVPPLVQISVAVERKYFVGAFVQPELHLLRELVLSFPEQVVADLQPRAFQRSVEKDSEGFGSLQLG
jgi:hypothetical protein